MSIRINTNTASIAAQRHLEKAENQVEHSLKALASGSRIVKPSDDAAGLAISEGLKGQISGIRQARNNTESAIGLIQSAEGGLNEQNNILIRLRELGVQAASDTVGDTEREYLNLEFSQLVSEFDRISRTTTFGTKQLLSGTGEKFEFQVGANSNPDNIIEFTLDADSSAAKLGIEGLTVEDQDQARDSLSDIDTALLEIAGVRANFGAIQSRLQSAQSFLDVHYENLTSARSRISDTDVAYETAQLLQGQVLRDMGTAVLAQSQNVGRSADRLLQALY